MQAVLGTTVEKISSNKSGYSGDTDIGEPVLRRYIGTMIAKGKSRRLIEAVLLSALAGGIAYGLATWIAPPSVSASLVALVIAGIVALATLAPAALLRALEQKQDQTSSTSDTYYDFSIDLKKEEGWKD